MSKEPELKARDKVVVRMTREGAVEENLTAGTEQRVSGTCLARTTILRLINNIYLE